MKAVDRPRLSLDFVWTDLLRSLQWIVACFGGLTGMLGLETGFSGLRLVARRKIRDVETMLRALLVVEAARLDVEDIPEPQTRAKRGRGEPAKPVHPRDDPTHPERWRAGFPGLRAYGFKVVRENGNAPDPFATYNPHDLAPLARRLEAIRRVLADLPGHARRWVRRLPGLIFSERRDKRRDPLFDTRHLIDLARDHARYEHHLWRKRRWEPG